MAPISVIARVLLILVLVAASVTLAADTDAVLPARQGLIAWFDARSLRGTDRSNDSLEVWTDTSGHGRDAVALGRAFQPKVVRDSSSGSPGYVRFDGADDFLVAQGVGKVSELTMLLVVRPRSNAGEFRGIVSTGPVDRNDYEAGMNIDLGPFPSGAWEMLNVESSGARGVANLFRTPKSLGSFQIISVVWKNGTVVSCQVGDVEEGTRSLGRESIAMDRLFLGCRHFRNEVGPPYERGFFDGDIAEVLIYDRPVSESERHSLHRYLREKHTSLLDAREDPLEPFQMLVPGFSIATLPLDVTNINDMTYDRSGRLWLLGYDGRIHIATDTDADGLEESLATFWDRPTIHGPLAIIHRPDGVYVSSKGKISKIIDDDQDGRGDREIGIASGWRPPENLSGGVDALGMAFDSSGQLYFALGCADYTNAYLVRDGRPHYTTADERGTIQRVTSDGRRELVCSGLRFPVSLAFDARGDLYATDQEGETWLPGGNPLDELLRIESGRHYGFPPQHSEYLPKVFDQPAVATYGPQHQSTCGLTFQRDDARVGPEHWAGSAFVTGYSRGKLWRTRIERDTSRTELIGTSTMLLVDVAISPDGALVVSAHSGKPDWGSGPTGKGMIFKVRNVDPRAPRPLEAWSNSPVEVCVAFAKGCCPKEISGVVVEYGEHVRAGDRFETLRPGYESVRVQQLAPRRRLPVREVQIDEDHSVIRIATAPMPMDVSYAATLHLSESDATPIDLRYDLSGLEVRGVDDGVTVWRGWWPHLDSRVSLAYLSGSLFHESLFELQPARVEFRTTVRPWLGRGVLQLKGLVAGNVIANGQPVAADGSVFRVPITGRTELLIGTDFAGAETIQAAFRPDSHALAIAIPVEAFRLPWAPEVTSEALPPPPPALEIVGGNWRKGREIFRSEAARCSACHRIGGEGGTIGPDLSNLYHRDVGSVMRDIVDPSASIHPDYTPMTLLLEQGEVVSGLIRPAGKGQIAIVGADAKERTVATAKIDSYTPSRVSIMPKGIDQAIGSEGMRDLLTFLTTPEPKQPASANGYQPPKRSRGEVERVLGKVLDVPESKVRPLNIVLVAGPKDHGPGEHDYPRWQAGWKELLAKAPKVRISTAFEWPKISQFELADVMIFYFWNHDWNNDRYAQLDEYLARGGGLVLLHAATIADKEPEMLSQRIGFAFQAGRSKFRHGPVRLEFTPADDPITRGLDGLDLVDETYWGLFGELTRVEVLATASEEGEARPAVWKYEPANGGRVFATVLGHYGWTFNDPLFRTIVLRGLAWAGGVPEGRLQRLATEGVTWDDARE